MTSSTLFNAGGWLASPGQSSYAELRQRLIANPGVALSSVFRARFGYDQYLWDYAPQKHCPACAKSLYHTTLFDYCWLHRCPVHGRLLQESCERCGNRWPKSSELRKRSCLSCSVPEWDDIPTGARLDSDRLAPVELVRNFLEDTEFSDDAFSDTDEIFDLSYTYLWDSLLRYPWPKRIRDDCAAFPAFQLATTSSHSRTELEMLGVAFPEFSIQRMTSPLGRLKLRPPSKAAWYDRLKRVGPIRRPPAKAQRIIERCYNEILVWCNRHHETGHHLSLGDFRCHSFPSLVDSDSYLCPFCAGVSAWWDAVTQKYFSPWQCSLPTEYWWTNDLQWSRWPDAPDRLIIMGQDEHCWRPGARFEEHYFERSLQLLFAELYQSIVHLMERLDASKCPYRPIWKPENSYSPGRFTASQCLWHITDNEVIEWVWADVNPLAELSLPRSSTKQRICGRATWAQADPRVETLVSALTPNSYVELSCETILEIGALFHHGRFEGLPRRHSWTILEQPL